MLELPGVDAKQDVLQAMTPTSSDHVTFDGVHYQGLCNYSITEMTACDICNYSLTGSAHVPQIPYCTLGAAVVTHASY